MPKGIDTRNHPGRRPQNPSAMGMTVGTYMGSGGNRHFFSSEATGGGETDSLSVSADPTIPNNLVQGARYSVSGPTVAHVRPYDG